MPIYLFEVVACNPSHRCRVTEILKKRIQMHKNISLKQNKMALIFCCFNILILENDIIYLPLLPAGQILGSELGRISCK